jgi:ribosomal protein S30
LHSDYPLAPERLEIEDYMLSPYSVRLSKEKRGKVQKLTPNLMPKKNYIIHYRNLKYYIDQGMVLTKVHRVVSFHQCAWMAPYISFNTEMRKLATCDFEKDLFKLLNNACFGKVSIYNSLFFVYIVPPNLYHGVYCT